MNKRSKSILRMSSVLFALVFFSSPGFSKDKEKVNWIGFDLPGLYGSDGGDGFVEKIQQYLITKLDKWDHTDIELLAVGRIVDELANFQENITIIPMKTPFKPEVAKKMHQSDLLHMFPPPGMIMTKETVKRIFGDKEPSIETFFNHAEKPVLAWVHGGTYHPVLRARVDKALESPVEKEQIHMMTLAENFEKLSEMLKLNRIDAYVDHAVSYQHSAKNSKHIREFQFVQFKEFSSPIPIFAYANKHEQSKDLIDGINAVAKTEEYRKVLAKTIADYFPESLREKYIELNNKSLNEALQAH